MSTGKAKNMKKVPSDLKYTKEHEWVKVEGDIATEGITYLAQHLLTDIVFVEIPEVGMKTTQMKPLMVIESVKSVSDIFASVSGKVIEVNEEVVDNPALVNEDPYGKGWLVKIKMKNPKELNNLLSAKNYEDFCKKVDH